MSLSEHPDARLRSPLLENWMLIKEIRLIPPYPPQWPFWCIQRIGGQILPFIADDLLQEFYMDITSPAFVDQNFESIRCFNNLVRHHFADVISEGYKVGINLAEAWPEAVEAGIMNLNPNDYFSQDRGPIARPVSPERKFLVIDGIRAMGFVTNCGPEGLHQKALEKFGPPPEGIRRRCVPQSIADCHVWELAEQTLDD
jgi:hypothetical protein